jgi:ribosome maturation factor RimP
MLAKNLITSIIQDFFEGTDFFVVDVSISGSDKISVFFEKMNGRVTIEDCVKLSKHIEAGLNRDEHDFELEVSSAGMDEPFKVIGQYYKHQGKEVKVITNDGKRHDGILKEVSADSILLETSEKVREEGKKKKIIITQEERLSFDQIKQTKRIIKF